MLQLYFKFQKLPIWFGLQHQRNLSRNFDFINNWKHNKLSAKLSEGSKMSMAFLQFKNWKLLDIFRLFQNKVRFISGIHFKPFQLCSKYFWIWRCKDHETNSFNNWLDSICLQKNKNYSILPWLLQNWFQLWIFHEFRWILYVGQIFTKQQNNFVSSTESDVYSQDQK